MKNKLNLLLTGFMQVLFVAFNTAMIAKGNIIASGFAAFAISYIWTTNVKKVAFGGRADQITYALGACLGNIAGIYLSKWI